MWYKSVFLQSQLQTTRTLKIGLKPWFSQHKLQLRYTVNHKTWSFCENQLKHTSDTWTRFSIWWSGQYCSSRCSASCNLLEGIDRSLFLFHAVKQECRLMNGHEMVYFKIIWTWQDWRFQDWTFVEQEVQHLLINNCWTFSSSLA